MARALAARRKTGSIRTTHTPLPPGIRLGIEPSSTSVSHFRSLSSSVRRCACSSITPSTIGWWSTVSYCARATRPKIENELGEKVYGRTCRLDSPCERTDVATAATLHTITISQWMQQSPRHAFRLRFDVLHFRPIDHLAPSVHTIREQLLKRRP